MALWNQKIAFEDDELLEIFGYRYDHLKSLVTYVLVMLSGGLVLLFFYWRPVLYLKMTHSPCKLDRADKIMIKDRYNQCFIETVKRLHKHNSVCKLPNVYPDQYDWEMAREACTRERLVIPCRDGFEEVNKVRYFNNKMIKFIWHDSMKRFKPLISIENMITLDELSKLRRVDTAEENARKLLYGPNRITIKDDNFWILLGKQIISPFPIYQIFCNIIYIWQEYYIFTAVIDIMTLLSAIYTAWKQMKTQELIKENIKPPIIVCVNRCVKGDPNPRKLYISSDRLVPGDILLIPKAGYEFMPCDALLTSGQCVVSEAMLNGESMPTIKSAMKILSGQHERFKIRRDSQHLLFSGCKILQTDTMDSQALHLETLVIRTGFNTINGNRIRCIIHPKPTIFQYNRDIKLYIGCLAGLAIFGIAFKLALNFSRYNDLFQPITIILESLDLITTAVSPALPACLAIGMVIAYQRLRRVKIHVLNPNIINVAGAINAIVFDKTGTLTENDIDILGVVDIDQARNKFCERIKPTHSLGFGPFYKGLVTCHTLTIIDNALSGDPLDVKMFAATKWRMKEYKMTDRHIRMVMRSPENSGDKSTCKTIGIVQRYAFDSNLQRMSIICNVYGNAHFEVYCKGSPEIMFNMCDINSIPPNYFEEYEAHATQGYRVLAFGYKFLPDYTLDDIVNVKSLSRDLIECNLWFLGFLIMDNPLKPETTRVVQDLSKIKMKMCIATGDGMHTTLSIAKQCGLIKKSEKIINIIAEGGPGKAQEIRYIYLNNTEQDAKNDIFEHTHFTTDYFFDDMENTNNIPYILAISGESFEMVRKYFPDIIPKLMVKGCIFARMLPEQKAQLVESLKEMEFYVAMCGDGSNDCRALKEAHAGISLSQAETSIAANFISNVQNITCVKNVLREGRAALSTSFGVFQYIAIYSCLQVISILLLSWIRSDLPDGQYLYLDLILLTLLIDLSSLGKSNKELSARYPDISLFGFIPFLSLLTYIGINMTIQLTVFKLTTWQIWWVQHNPQHKRDYSSYEESAIFSLTTFQYLYLAIAYFEGKPHRKPIYKNYWLITYMIGVFVVNVYITVSESDRFHTLIKYYVFPSMEFRQTILGVAIVNGFLMLVAKEFLVKVLYVNIQKNCMNPKYVRWQRVELELKKLTKWPPVVSDIEPNVGRMRRFGKHSIGPVDIEVTIPNFEPIH